MQLPPEAAEGKAVVNEGDKDSQRGNARDEDDLPRRKSNHAGHDYKLLLAKQSQQVVVRGDEQRDRGGTCVLAAASSVTGCR